MPEQQVAAVVDNGNSGTPPDLDLQAISLEQALADFETANARVLDLTQRLLDAVAERRQVRSELELLRIDHARLQAEVLGAHSALAAFQEEVAAERASRVYLLVRGLRGLRRLLDP